MNNNKTIAVPSDAAAASVCCIGAMRNENIYVPT